MPGSWTDAKLVIKPQDLGIGKALKATVGLHSLNGRANVDLEDLTFVEGLTSLSLGQIPNDVCKVQTLTFTNFGSVHGFVCVRAFADEGLEKPLTKPDLVLIEPSHFVLGPKGGRQVVTVRVDPLVVNQSEETSHVASLAILSGPEAARKILAGSAAIVGVSRIGPQFNAEDLKKISSNVKVGAVLTLFTSSLEF